MASVNPECPRSPGARQRFSARFPRGVAGVPFQLRINTTIRLIQALIASLDYELLKHAVCAKISKVTKPAIIVAVVMTLPRSPRESGTPLGGHYAHSG